MVHGSLARMVPVAEPPTAPRSAKRRRTGLKPSSHTHTELYQQGGLGARLAGVEAREAAVAAREGFCERLEAELTARGALLEAQAAAATARAVGVAPPADTAAQAAAALQILQALAANGGLPTEVRRSRQHEAMQAGAAAAMPNERPAHPDRHNTGLTADGTPAHAAHAAGQRELGVKAEPCGAMPGGRSGQPAFSAHSHHSTMSHATAIGHANDSPDSPRSHPRFLLQLPSAPPSPLLRSGGAQKAAARAQRQHAGGNTPAREMLDSQLDGHATPGHQSCSGSPDLSVATGPSSDRFSSGSLRAVPRSPFAGPPHDADPQRLTPGAAPPAGTLNLAHDPALVSLLLRQMQQGAGSRQGAALAGAAADSAAEHGASARQPVPAAAAPGGYGRIGRLNSAHGSSVDATGGTHGGVRIRLSNSAPRLDLVGPRTQQQHGPFLAGQPHASAELRAASLAGQRRHNSADQPLVVADARQPGLDSLANVAAADADGANLPLLPASSGAKPAAAAADACAGPGQQAPAAFSFQPPSPSASSRSRAGSVAAEDLVYPCDRVPALQQPQTLQQAVGGGAAGRAQAPFPPQGGSADRRQRGGAAAAAGATASRSAADAVGAGAGAAASGARLPLAFSKTLDYKSCDHILCLTKDMARQLLPPAPHSCTATGSSCQMQVELEDPAGRLWPMTYRSVPARYSYEFRAGWKAFASAWGIATGDAITLARDTDNRHRLRIQIMHGVSSGATGGAARPARGGTAASRGASGAGGGALSAAPATAGNSGGSAGAGSLNPGAAKRHKAPDEPAQSAAMAPLLAAVQQAAEHMMEP